MFGVDGGETKLISEMPSRGEVDVRVFKRRDAGEGPDVALVEGLHLSAVIWHDGVNAGAFVL